MQWNIWQLIKAGFWIGIGFIIPSLFVDGLSSIAVVKMMPSMMQSEFASIDGEEEDDFDASDLMSEFKDKYDKTKQVKILEHRQSLIGEQLFIFGKVKNTSKNDISSIQLEAELFNDKEEFVFECNEYISRTLKPNDEENFQIRCGCSGQVTPKYSSISIRVVSVSSY